jgi:hypothetical protein
MAARDRGRGGSSRSAGGTEALRPVCRGLRRLSSPIRPSAPSPRPPGVRGPGWLRRGRPSPRVGPGARHRSGRAAPAGRRGQPPPLRPGGRLRSAAELARGVGPHVPGAGAKTSGPRAAERARGTDPVAAPQGGGAVCPAPPDSPRAASGNPGPREGAPQIGVRAAPRSGREEPSREFGPIEKRGPRQASPSNSYSPRPPSSPAVGATAFFMTVRRRPTSAI